MLDRLTNTAVSALAALGIALVTSQVSAQDDEAETFDGEWRCNHGR